MGGRDNGTNDRVRVNEFLELEQIAAYQPSSNFSSAQGRYNYSDMKTEQRPAIEY